METQDSTTENGDDRKEAHVSEGTASEDPKSEADTPDPSENSELSLMTGSSGH